MIPRDAGESIAYTCAFALIVIGLLTGLVVLCVLGLLMLIGLAREAFKER